METFLEFTHKRIELSVLSLIVYVFEFGVIFYFMNDRIKTFKTYNDKLIDIALESQYIGIVFALNTMIHKISVYKNSLQINAQAKSWCTFYTQYLRNYKINWDPLTQSFTLHKLDPEGKPRHKARNRELIIWSKTAKGKTYGPKDFCKFNPN